MPTVILSSALEASEGLDVTVASLNLVECNIAPFYGTATAGAGDTVSGRTDDLVDDSTITAWTGVADAVLTIDLGAPIEIKRYELGFDFFFGDPPDGWVLEGSDDNSIWTTLDTGTGVGTSASTSSSASFDITPSTFRYWRFTFSSSLQVTLTEIRLIRDCLAPPELATAIVAVEPEALTLQATAELLLRTIDVAVERGQLALGTQATEFITADITVQAEQLTLASKALDLTTAEIVVEAGQLTASAAPISFTTADIAVEPETLTLEASVAFLALQTKDVTVEPEQLSLQETGLVVSTADISVEVGQLEVSQPVLRLQTADIAVQTPQLFVAPVDTRSKFVRPSAVPFTAPVPLRLTSVWGAFAGVEPIPWRYGSIAGRLLQHNARKTLWVWADHPCQGIDEVLIGGQPASGWRWYNGVDITGRAVCFVEFSDPAEDQPIARGRGRMSEGGELMINPGEVILDIRRNIAGQDVADMQEFIADTAAADIEIGGSVRDDRQSLQGLISDIINSVDAVWSASMDGFARLRTGLPSSGFTLDEAKGGSADASASIDSVTNVLDIAFADDDDGATQSLIMEAPRSIDDFGRRAESVRLPWVQQPRLAESSGRQMLQRSARPLWNIELADADDVPDIGTTATVNRTGLPFTGQAIITAVDTDQLTGRASASLQQQPSGDERVDLVRTGSQFGIQAAANAAITTQGDQRLITILDTNNQPVSSAAVTLNGTLTRFTDTGGRVNFPAAAMPPGQHVLEVTTRDLSFSFTVTV